METVLQPPAPFQFDNNLSSVTSGNLCKSWSNWKKSFEVYFEACELNKKEEKVQISILLHVIGSKCREVFEQFSPVPVTFKAALLQFDKFFLPKTNVTVERHRFNTRNQKSSESTEQYVFELNKLASRCEFKDLCSDLVRDRLICGINDSALRERLLRERNLTLSSALDICRLAEMSQAQAVGIKSEAETHHVHQLKKEHGTGLECQQSENEYLHWVRSGNCRCGARYGKLVSPAAAAAAAPRAWEPRGRRRRGRGRGRGRGNVPAASAQPENAAGRSGPSHVPLYRPRSDHGCSKCGASHEYYKCPAYGVQCTNCNRYNHYAKMCPVYAVEEGSSEQVCRASSSNDWTAKIKINDCSIDFKIDTGADVNVLPSAYLQKIKIQEQDLTPTSIKLYGYSGNVIGTIGKCYLKLKYKNSEYILKFIIANVTSPPILGRTACQELNLVKRIMSVNTDNRNNNILDSYSDIFQGIGCLPGEYKIRLKDNALPVIHSPRKLPIALRDSVKNKLLDMEKQQIIAKVEGPTDWVNSMTLAKKPNGDFRICLDPQDLNKVIRREHFKLPTLDEITSRLLGSKWFSTLDAKQGFWQVKLSSESTDLCTFNTVFGRYKFLRLPYGISSASEVFHKKLLEHFDDLEGVCQFIDDLLIYGKTKEEHDERLRKVLERCRKINIKLNREKCKIGLNQIKYLGHKISEHGVSPDDTHTSAIRNMPRPTSVKDLERFLGLVTYVGNFVPNLSDKTHLLRDLLKKDVEWHWNEQHEKSFVSLKRCLINPPILQFYSLDKPITLSVDSSKNGLGACLLQNNLPVCYASKTLTKTEQAYAQIEKELYACVFACEKFYAYIYGRSDVTIETDHKPLISIINKPIVNTPPRLQRMLMRLQPYTFKLVYKPGKYLYIADTLSRACELSQRGAAAEPRDQLEAQAQVCALTACNPLTDTHFLSIQKCTRDDGEMQLLIKTIKKGWPANRNDVDVSIRCYWDVRDELTMSYGLVWKGTRIVIPKCLRSNMLKKIHVTHMGIEKCKLRARETMYWPNINSQIKDMISHCQACLTYRKANSKETLIQHDIPASPWLKVAADIFHFGGESFLLVVDYFSKFVEVVKIKSLMSDNIIKKLKIIFSRQGIPAIFMSDNGPEFSSEAFRQFAYDWNFEHITSSPRYAQSNGQVERSIQILKNILKKTTYSNDDFRLALLEYLNTPISSEIPSPAELLNSRKLRSIVPCSPNLLKSRPPSQNVIKKFQERKAKEKLYYDKNARDLPPLHDNQKVKVYINNKWEAGTIRKVVGIRSYLVSLGTGRTVIRNRRHIILDSVHRNDDSISVRKQSYDDIDVSNSHTGLINNNTNDPYITRYGRTVRRPERWGFTDTYS